MSEAPEARPAEQPRAAFTPAEVATQLGIPIKAVRALIRSGDLRSRCYVGTPGGRTARYVVPRDAVTEYLAATG